MIQRISKRNPGSGPRSAGKTKRHKTIRETEAAGPDKPEKTVLYSTLSNEAEPHSKADHNLRNVPFMALGGLLKGLAHIFGNQSPAIQQNSNGPTMMVR